METFSLCVGKFSHSHRRRHDSGQCLSSGICKRPRNSDKSHIFQTRRGRSVSNNGLALVSAALFSTLPGNFILIAGSCLTVAELCNIFGLQRRSYYLFTPTPPHPTPHPPPPPSVALSRSKSCLKLLIIPLREAEQLTLSGKSRALNLRKKKKDLLLSYETYPAVFS